MADESKADRFRRLANARVNRCLKDIALVGNLAAPGYESTPEQREAVLNALITAVESTASKFMGTSDAPKFSL